MPRGKCEVGAPVNYTCCDCAHRFSEDQLVIVPGTFFSGCPACHSENIKDTWPQKITVMPVSTAGLEEQARKMIERMERETS
jgi:Zn finger protein HypA/HybF involved in hydrogenase expression